MPKSAIMKKLIPPGSAMRDLYSGNAFAHIKRLSRSSVLSFSRLGFCGAYRGSVQRDVLFVSSKVSRAMEFLPKCVFWLLWSGLQCLFGYFVQFQVALSFRLCPPVYLLRNCYRQPHHAASDPEAIFDPQFNLRRSARTTLRAIAPDVAATRTATRIRPPTCNSKSRRLGK
jgi:hypothetical protein